LFNSNLLGYVNLLRQHIAKENNALFPMADQVIADTEQDKLYDAFEHIEATCTGPSEHERSHAMIAESQKIAASWV
jgi:hemerythrin-like domain-containing protein